MRKALEPLLLSWRVPALRARIIFVLAAMVLYVFAVHIPVPSVNQSKMEELIKQSGGLLNFVDIFSGGALRNVSVLALGIMPYITSSIIFQILTIAFPQIKELQKEGEYGRRKIAQWTRWAAIALTFIQAIVATRAFLAFGVLDQTQGHSVFALSVLSVVSLTAGTMFLLWLGEQITARGVGNGISFIIFAGIVARLPYQIQQTSQVTSIFQRLLLIVAFVGTAAAVIFVTQGERRIPVKYAPRQAGRRMVQGQRSNLPLKMAAAGVIPIIFAISLVLLPGQIAQLYLGSIPQGYNGTGRTIASYIGGIFGPHSVVASLLYALLVMGFTYFYTAVIFDVRDLSDNLKKSGGQIQGYAPGRPTELYINKVLTRITFAGGVFLASIALLQWWLPTILGIPPTGGGATTLVGGTSLLIVVGVALEIMQNLDQQLKMRQYEGLVKQMNRGGL